MSAVQPESGTHAHEIKQWILQRFKQPRHEPRARARTVLAMRWRND
jgi:hypothetical protein